MPDVAALGDLHVAELADGVYAWVTAESTCFTLRKDSGVTPNPDIIAPSAGAAGARWFRTNDELLHAIFSVHPKAGRP